MPGDREFIDFLNKEMENELNGESEEDPDAPLLDEEKSVNIPLNGSPLSLNALNHHGPIRLR